ncbi:Translocase of chloroplast 90 [Monoraphidium neglectum]|uniref:Translocase of chloroplast 90 n=1 Tax=Monoraphidium neglectum TaxID=145388 RepID=A0A0D2LWT6_9CHLO|nr:Translocase of chloroplast 90 [Monoraphidium neglectum]KIY94001.1 Translocase of chloroplast 90 [Monoraphidium neglectum]|eukprot:XP_013893021.1 Translocase of chloroplast 90 [Monoraphidium neglectum]
MPLTGDAVTQFLKVVDRIEELGLPGPGRRADAMRAAYSEAAALNEAQDPDSRLGIGIKLLLVGLTGTGKSELANTLLERPAIRTNAFREATKKIRVVKGDVRGIGLTIIDTPGLHASSDMALSNRGILRSIGRAYKKHKPDFVIYVDRLDAAKASFGELSTLTQLGEVLGKGVWRNLMVVLTHANAAREQMGAEYAQTMKQRRNILGNIMRQVSGEMQLKTPSFLADCHPGGPRNAAGQPVVWDVPGAMAAALAPTPWREQLLMQLLGYAAYHRAQDAAAAATSKPKAKPAAAAQTQQQQARGAAAGRADSRPLSTPPPPNGRCTCLIGPSPPPRPMMARMRRSRMPPTSYFVEQMVEGVLKPDTYATVEDPFDRETDDEEAEEFNTQYYQLMRGWARQGDPTAQKEYAAWLRKLSRAKRAYAEAYRNEDNETLAAYGYEGYVAEGLDLGPTFDPEDVTDHRYQYVVTDTDVAIMPTLDYYG